MTKRSYQSTVRAATAQDTRTAILRAAMDLFVANGYVRTTVTAIADRAAVGVNTVYTSVGGKPALIRALAQEGADDATIDTTVTDIQTMTDGRLILRRTAEGTAEVTHRRAALLRMLVENATSDPAVAAAAELAVHRYRERLATTAEHLVAVGAVRFDSGRTEQILWFYFGLTAWSTVRELGWTWADGARWLADQAAAALLTD